MVSGGPLDRRERDGCGGCGGEGAGSSTFWRFERLGGWTPAGSGFGASGVCAGGLAFRFRSVRDGRGGLGAVAAAAWLSVGDRFSAAASLAAERVTLEDMRYWSVGSLWPTPFAGQKDLCGFGLMKEPGSKGGRHATSGYATRLLCPRQMVQIARARGGK